MRITQLAMARLVNTGNYENTRWELTAELAPGEDPQQVAHAMALQLIGIIGRERMRRFPEERERRYRMWLEEDEWAASAQPADATPAPDYGKGEIGQSADI